VGSAHPTELQNMGLSDRLDYEILLRYVGCIEMIDHQLPDETSQLFPSQLTDQSDLHTMLTALLSAVCAKTDWEYGESWLFDAQHNTLELSPAWCVRTDLELDRAVAWMQFQICSKAFTLHPNEGLPGRVWASQQPEWIADVSDRSETYFLRNQIATAFGVRAGLGIPIALNSATTAVIVFFMSEMRPDDQALIAQTQATIAEFKRLSPQFFAQ
jgi:hypothetical protein